MYDAALTLRAARADYFARSGFASDGGYGDRWVKVKLGGRWLPAFPNVAARVRAVQLHDLHHVLAEYDTSWRGEAEIAAWELASGCRGYIAAWILNLGGMLLGVILAPRRVARAFARGRRTRNLYATAFDDALLERNVGELRAELGLTPTA
ncbi:MAG TPA: hypothetical protein VJZ76_10355 [Thermoanaerobaculia bacterium]|nr:hypothetical protein [Thermoanaerobaculia bacterium]